MIESIQLKIISLFGILSVVFFCSGQDASGISLKGTYTQKSVYLDVGNTSNDFIPFFNKQLEKVGLTEKYYEVVVADNRIAFKGDTLIIDLTSKLDSVDSLDSRVIRFTNYNRWQTSHLEPHEQIKFKIKIKKKLLHRVDTIIMKVEGNNRVTELVIPRKKIARFYLRHGKMFL